jgi:L-alanine-DL-glutamate epimerase-like enolase superfamily enzyme
VLWRTISSNPVSTTLRSGAVDPSANPLRDAFGDFTLAADGSMPLPDGPGLGIEIDEKRFQRYVTQRWTIAG